MVETLRQCNILAAFSIRLEPMVFPQRPDYPRNLFPHVSLCSDYGIQLRLNLTLRKTKATQIEAGHKNLSVSSLRHGSQSLCGGIDFLSSGTMTLVRPGLYVFPYIVLSMAHRSRSFVLLPRVSAPTPARRRAASSVRIQLCKIGRSRSCGSLASRRSPQAMRFCRSL